MRTGATGQGAGAGGKGAGAKGQLLMRTHAAALVAGGEPPLESTLAELATLMVVESGMELPQGSALTVQVRSRVQGPRPRVQGPGSRVLAVTALTLQR